MKRVIANAKLRDIEVARLSLLLIRKYVLRLYRTKCYNCKFILHLVRSSQSIEFDLTD